MKLFFATADITELAARTPPVLATIKETLLKNYAFIEEVNIPGNADAIIIQENRAFKDFRYIDKLLQDPFIGKYLTKIFTINMDDSSTGLLRGLYTSMRDYRFNSAIHRAVPFIYYTNQFVFTDENVVRPNYLAGWYGNVRSSRMRKALVDTYQGEGEFCIKTSQSWYTHKGDEQRDYVELIKNCKFSLCPTGFAPSSPRIYESMALGRCPVIIADHFIPPAGPDWKDFALFYPEKNGVANLRSFLREHEPRHKEFGAKAKQNWDKFFSGDLIKQYYADALISLIRSTSPYTKEEEIRRWRSFSMYWNNRWTVPQRALNKYRKWLEKVQDIK